MGERRYIKFHNNAQRGDRVYVHIYGDEDLTAKDLLSVLTEQMNSDENLEMEQLSDSGDATGLFVRIYMEELEIEGNAVVVYGEVIERDIYN